MTEYRHMLFVGGYCDGRTDVVDTTMDHWDIAIPPRFDETTGTLRSADRQCYTPRTVFVGPGEGIQGPAFPVRVMVAAWIRNPAEVDSHITFLARRQDFPALRREAIQRAVEYKERRP